MYMNMFLIIICIPAPPRCAKKNVYILESYVCEFVPRKDMMSIAVPFCFLLGNLQFLAGPMLKTVPGIPQIFFRF